MRAHLLYLFPLENGVEGIGDTSGVSRELSTSGFSFLIVTLRCFDGGGRVESFEGTEVLPTDEVVVMEDEAESGFAEVDARLSLRKARGSSPSSSILSARS